MWKRWEASVFDQRCVMYSCVHTTDRAGCGPSEGTRFQKRRTRDQLRATVMQVLSDRKGRI